MVLNFRMPNKARHRIGHKLFNLMKPPSFHSRPIRRVLTLGKIMKYLALVVAVLLAGLLVPFVSSRATRVSPPYAEAKVRIDGLGNHHDIELIGTQVWDHCTAVLGSRAEKRLRELFALEQRETPSRIEDFYFRDGTGEFTVQILDQEGGNLKISVYTRSGSRDPSESTFAVLHRLFPCADFVVLP